MAESQDDIDALLAEVTDLADEAVADVVGGEPAEDTRPGPAPESALPAEPPKAPPSGEPQLEGPASDPRPPAPAPPAEDVNRILHLEVPVIVQLAERTMPLSEIVNLNTGAIIEFEKPADGELDLMINNKCIGHGLAVKVAENFGLRVTRTGSVQDRIKAMGSAQ